MKTFKEFKEERQLVENADKYVRVVLDKKDPYSNMEEIKRCLHRDSNKLVGGVYKWYLDKPFGSIRGTMEVVLFYDKLPEVQHFLDVHKIKILDIHYSDNKGKLIYEV